MPHLFVKRGLAFVVLPCLLIPACSMANKNLAKQTSVESGKSMAAGDFKKALDTYNAAYKRNPRDRELAGNYVRTIEEIRQAADQALSRRDYTRAGSIYRLLLDNYAGFGGLAAKLTFKKPFLETTLRYCQVALVDSQARQALNAGNLAKALDTYQAALKENPGDADLAAKYRGTVDDIKAVGNKALDAKDFAQAGRVDVFLLKNFPSFEGLRPPVAFSRETLSDAIAVCRDGLTKAGLEEYRKGNLAKAIAVWEDLLAFDPDNAEIKKAVDTARVQLNKVIKKF
jgi:tetratricopeptide (TPR) repeat protein